jgi:hypothetical protein
VAIVPTQPGGFNTYVPELTSKLVVDFSRDISKFAMNRYTQIIPVDKQTGRYAVMTREEAGRVYADGLAEWPDGKVRPEHNGELETFGFAIYETRRRNWGFTIGRLGVEQAAWNVAEHQAGIKAEQVMRYRTKQILTNATTTGNYLTEHTSAVSSITGVAGKWDVSTTARCDIKRSLDYARDTIDSSTLNGVDVEKDLILVMSAGCARKISVSQEIVDMIKQSPFALAQIRGELPGTGKNAAYGLPDHLYGMQLVVENTKYTSSRKGATKAVGALLADTTPFICSRVGGLDGGRVAEAPSWSTHVLLMYEEMSVERFDEPKDRRLLHSITDDYSAIMPSNISGFLFTAAVD